MSQNSQPQADNSTILAERLWSDENHDWLSMNYPFLTAAGFKAAAELEMDLRTGRQESAVTQITDQIWSMFLEVRAAITQSAEHQMRSLAALAASPSPEAQQARAAICAMLLGSFEQAFDVHDFCQHSAAEVLVTIAQEPGPTADLALLSCAAICLTRRIELSENVRINLLTAFDLLCARARNEVTISGDDIGIVLTDILMLELLRPESCQSLRYCRQILALMRTYKHRPAVSVLQSIAEFHSQEPMRQLAAESLRACDSPLQHLWDATPVDQIANDQSRAQRLADTNRATRDCEILTQTIFNNMKGAPLAKMGDKRIYPLRKLLMHVDNQIRLATCWAILSDERYSASLDDQLGCIEVLADLAVNSRSLTVGRDAVTLMNRLQKAHPNLEPRLSAACGRATQRFVSKQQWLANPLSKKMPNKPTNLR